MASFAAFNVKNGEAFVPELLSMPSGETKSSKGRVFISAFLFFAVMSDAELLITTHENAIKIVFLHVFWNILLPALHI
jgi:hypothetical protein